MALPADPVLIPPANTSEASLRIQESIPGATAKGHVSFTIPAADLVPQMFGGDRPKELLAWEFGSVDVTQFCENLGKNRDGTLKRPGRESDSDSFADPMLYDDYTHVDRPDDKVVFTQHSAAPHFGSTGPRPETPEPPRPGYEERLAAWREAKAAQDAADDPERITDEQLLAEFVAKTGVKMEPTRTEEGQVTISPEELAKYPSRQAYEPMKSGVWIATLENEDDIKALHPDPALDEKPEPYNFQTYVKDFYSRLQGVDTPLAKDPLDRRIEKKLEPVVERLDELGRLIKLLVEGKTL